MTARRSLRDQSRWQLHRHPRRNPIRRHFDYAHDDMRGASPVPTRPSFQLRPAATRALLRLHGLRAYAGRAQVARSSRGRRLDEKWKLAGGARWGSELETDGPRGALSPASRLATSVAASAAASSPRRSPAATPRTGCSTAPTHGARASRFACAAARRGRGSGPRGRWSSRGSQR